MLMSKQYHRSCRICVTSFISNSGHCYYCESCRTEGKRLADGMCRERRKLILSEIAHKRYSEGIIYVCKECGRKIKVHERTRRSICNECASKTAYGRELMRNRKDIKEEVIG